jgi:hypothetical protein
MESIDHKLENSPVHGLVVSFRRDHFWCEIVGGPAKCPCNVRHLLCEAEIGNLQVAMSVEEQVFWLEIAINDIQRVQVVQREGDFSGVELGNRVGESLFIVNMGR